MRRWRVRALVKLRTFIPCGSPVWFVPAFIKLQLSTLAVCVQKALLGCHNFLLSVVERQFLGLCVAHWHNVTRAAAVGLGSATPIFPQCNLLISSWDAVLTYFHTLLLNYHEITYLPFVSQALLKVSVQITFILLHSVAKSCAS